MTAADYIGFIERKSHTPNDYGFDPRDLPDYLYDFQADLVRWALQRGRAGIFADCGLGKTPMQLTWAQKVVERTSSHVLIVTPLAVVAQTLREAAKFGVDAVRSHRGEVPGTPHVVITNYERVHHFDPDQFAGVVCDESSAIKNFEGKRREQITALMRTRPYRLLCTATAAPNDFIELGTSCEALGLLGRMDMLARFFKNDENSNHPIWWGARWRLKRHAERNFWRWVCSWARAVRKPSDLGYEDGAFSLPDLVENEHVVQAARPRPGVLFDLPALTLDEQREERRHTLPDRCAKVAELVDHSDPAVIWCHLNAEADELVRIIPDAEQVQGSDSDEAKEERLLSFSDGKLRVLVIKPKIGAFGLNWQHCSHMTFFPSHSFEQYYQGVRRCWRFGQQRPVTVDMVTSVGETGVLDNLVRKQRQADEMFTELVREMRNSMEIDQAETYPNKAEVPPWL